MVQGGCHLSPEGWPPAPSNNDCSSTACYSACNIGASCSEQAWARKIVMTKPARPAPCLASASSSCRSVCRSPGAVTIRVICRDILDGSGAYCFVCPAHIAILGPLTIPNDYSSTTTIPNLNCRFPERRATMQETYADWCREGYRGKPEWATKFQRNALSVRRWTPPRRP